MAKRRVEIMVQGPHGEGRKSKHLNAIGMYWGQTFVDARVVAVTETATVAETLAALEHLGQGVYEALQDRMKSPKERRGLRRQIRKILRGVALPQVEN